MVGTKSGRLAAILICGVCAFASVANAQTVNVQGPIAGSTAKTEKGVTVNGNNSTAGVETGKPDSDQLRAENQSPAKGSATIVPKPTANAVGNMAPLNGDESGVAPRADTANATGPDSQAIRSADSTAHQTVYDPNNQLGTSVAGKTLPVPGSTDQAAQTQQQNTHD